VGARQPRNPTAAEPPARLIGGASPPRRPAGMGFTSLRSSLRRTPSSAC